MTWEAATGIIGLGVIWLVNMTAFQLDEEHTYFKAFLMVMSFFLAVPLVNYGLQLAIDNSASSEAQGLFSTFTVAITGLAALVFLYIFWYTIAKVAKAMIEKKKKERGEM